MKNNKQFIIILAILLVTVAISVPAYLIVPREKGEALVSKFPMQIGEWKGKDLPVDDRTYEILETKNLILREYAKGDDKVYLYIIYSQDNRKVSHPPEVCFEGSGITVVKKDRIQIDLTAGKKISVNKLIVEKEGLSNVILYWYKAGDYYIDSYLKQQLQISLSRLQFKRTSGAMIRISAEISPTDSGRAFENAKAFAKEASAYFPQVIP
jgi:EpsI family protein